MQIAFLDVQKLLISKGIVNSIAAANATSIYLIQWAEGFTFDTSKSSFAVHRARLRKIGLDIAKPCTLKASLPLNLVFETNVKGF